MKNPEILTASVNEDLRGLRLDVGAAQLFPQYSRARLQQWIRSGRLQVDGETVTPRQKLLGGEQLSLLPEAEPDDRLRAEPVPLNILHEDEDLLVLDKPAGLVVHPAVGHPGGTLQNGLLHHDADLAGVPRAGIVHHESDHRAP